MNRNLTGGYYLVSLDDVDLASESEIVLADVAKLLYFAKVYKFVVFQDIVIDGEKKTAIPAMFEADMTLSTKPEDWDDETDGEFVPQELYTATIYNVYGKNIAIDAEGVASVTDYEVPPDIDSLYGKFVRIMEAPESTRLTEEQADIIQSGVAIVGDFLGLRNPLFYASQGVGIVIGSPAGAVLQPAYVSLYLIDVHRDISLQGPRIELMYSPSKCVITNQNGSLMIGIENNLLKINDKYLPAYPTDQTDKTYVPKLVNGELTWVEETA